MLPTGKRSPYQEYTRYFSKIYYLPRPYVDVRINHSTIRALLDTGAEVSCIQESTLRRVWPEYQTTGERVTELTLADRSVVVLTGKVRLVIRVGDSQIRHKFRILDRLDTSLIIGVDLWVRLGIALIPPCQMRGYDSDEEGRLQPFYSSTEPHSSHHHAPRHPVYEGTRQRDNDEAMRPVTRPAAPRYGTGDWRLPANQQPPARNVSIATTETVTRASTTDEAVYRPTTTTTIEGQDNQGPLRRGPIFRRLPLAAVHSSPHQEGQMDPPLHPDQAVPLLRSQMNAAPLKRGSL